MNIYTIPPDVPFLQTLARAVLDGSLPVPGGGAPDPMHLPRWRIYLPTRRAQAALEDAFLNANGGRPLLLPQVVALGEVDDLAGDEDLQADNLPQAVGPLERRFILSRMIIAWAGRFPDNALARIARSSTARALALADSLGKLIDGFEISEISLDRLSEVLDLEMAGHLEEAIAFLTIVREEFPEELRRLDRVGRYARQRHLMDALVHELQTRPPSWPVIAAGSTGSIPATARLLKAIAERTNGAVVLPGLYREMDEASWQALDQQDAQYGLKELLNRLGIERHAVRDAPGLRRTEAGSARTALLAEVTRPAATTEAWNAVLTNADQRLVAGRVGLRTFEAPDQRTEALAIAVLLRGVLEEPGATASLVTPDRRLALRVAAELRRWRIDVEDSAGQPLTHTGPGLMAMLLLKAMNRHAQAHDLLALLRHPLMTMGPSRQWLDRTVSRFEIAVLRGPRQPIDPATLRERIRRAREAAGGSHVHRLVRNLTERDWQDIEDLGSLIEQRLDPLHRRLMAPSPRPLNELAAAHREAYDAVCGRLAGRGGAQSARAQERLDALFDALGEQSLCPPLFGEDYLEFFGDAARQETVRHAASDHPRIQVLGLLEARLVRSDVTILAGLNEGVWPSLTAPDPWMNRPQKQRLGLQLPERRVGLNAHDFVQNAAGPRVWLTWSRKIGGTPSMPSRFVERLQMLCGEKALADPDLAAMVDAIDAPAAAAALAVPQPRPPQAHRPTKLSVSDVHLLQTDPYGYYAKRILKLRPLEPLAADPTAADRGNLVHAIAHRFVIERSQNPQADRVALFRRIADEQMATMAAGPAARAFLSGQLARLATYFVEIDAALSADAVKTLAEVEGEIRIAVDNANLSTLTARADRIDVFDDGVCIVDYKTGTIPSTNDAAGKFHPQLLLEALIAERGGFAGLGPARVKEASFVKLSGRDISGDHKPLKHLAEKTRKAEEGLYRLLAAYADERQSYNAVIPNKGHGDYDLLSRWKEWSSRVGDAMPERSDDVGD